MTEEKENCNFQQNYNVFGLDDKPCCYLYHKYCDEIEGCYFKKYKRLKQERDELKFENDRYKQLLKGCPTEDEDCGLCVIDEQNKRLKQENKELQAYKDINEDFKKAWDELNEKYKQLRSALEKIRIIIVINKDEFDHCLYHDYDEQILNKINEVLNDGRE